MIRIAKWIAVVAAAMFGAGGVHAQDQLMLKVSLPFAANHFQFTESVKVFEDAVTKATNGKVRFQNYFSGQLGSEPSSVLTSGLADIGAVPPSYETAKFPMSSVVELPGMFSTAVEGTKKAWNILKDGGPLYEAEYKPLGIKVLFVNVHAPFQLITASKPIKSLNDVAGLKVRANGSAADKVVRALGAVPVRVTSNEMYDAVSRGTVDGILFPIGVMRHSHLSLEKFLRHTVEGTQLSASLNVIAIRQKTWDSLPPDVKVAMEKAAADTQKSVSKWIDDAYLDEIVWLTKDQKFTVTKLSNEEIARFKERLQVVPVEWAKELESTGRPGTAMVKAFRESPAQ